MLKEFEWQVQDTRAAQLVHILLYRVSINLHILLHRVSLNLLVILHRVSINLRPPAQGFHKTPCPPPTGFL
jgi:hypothetical protein